ncbi:hypothetical protein K469DRAFT_578263, partial [Zopfia rhizophila CBS 207.26]
CLLNDNQFIQFAWQDLRVVLFMSAVHRGQEWVTQLRRRLAKTATNSAITEAPFGDEPCKEMVIPLWDDEYNHNINGVDRFDGYKAEYDTKRLTYCTWKPFWYFLFEALIINAYLLCARGLEGQKHLFKSQL